MTLHMKYFSYFSGSSFIKMTAFFKFLFHFPFFLSVFSLLLKKS